MNYNEIIENQLKPIRDAAAQKASAANAGLASRLQKLEASRLRSDKIVEVLKALEAVEGSQVSHTVKEEGDSIRIDTNIPFTRPSGPSRNVYIVVGPDRFGISELHETVTTHSGDMDDDFLRTFAAKITIMAVQSGRWKA